MHTNKIQNKKHTFRQRQQLFDDQNKNNKSKNEVSNMQFWVTFFQFSEQMNKSIRSITWH